MGMSTGGTKGGVQSAINVTPLIDVLLVLLIIFLVVMPIMMKSETLDVPRELAPPEMVIAETVTLTITLKADGTCVFNDGVRDQSIATADIAPTLRGKLAGARMPADKVVFVDFDDKVA